MEKKCVDDLYEILDELNAQIEEIFNEHNNPEIAELILSKLNQKAKEFLYDFEMEIEKLDLMEIEV